LGFTPGRKTAKRLRPDEKYLHVIKHRPAEQFAVIAFNFLTRTLFSFIPLFAMLSLWRTIYAGI